MTALRTILACVLASGASAVAVPALWAAGPAPAPADTTARTITLAEAVSLAEQNALAIVQARGQRRVSAAGVRSTAASFLPSVSLSAGASRQYSATRTRVENGQVVVLPTDPSHRAGGRFGSLFTLIAKHRRPPVSLAHPP